MNAKKYLDLLFEGKKEEAEHLRSAAIPDKVIKFFWLDGSRKDKKKLSSLKRDEIWFAHKDILNDPYEYKGMLIDREKMQDAGYPAEIIDKYETLLDFSDYGITCFSSNNIDYLPMWAYYTNNHQGYCVEYEVINKSCIHEVFYEDDRIKVASLLFQCKEAIKHAIISGDSKRADFYTIIFLQNLFIKSSSWQHENECRIVYPLNNDTGINVPVSQLGLKTSKIIAGINCSKSNIKKLNKISNSLGLGDVYKSKIHSEKYTIETIR